LELAQVWGPGFKGNGGSPGPTAGPTSV
jgi:hypothetical protein